MVSRAKSAEFADKCFNYSSCGLCILALLKKSTSGQLTKPYVDVLCAQGEWVPSPEYKGPQSPKNNFVIRV